ncbi:GATA-type zinc finger protein 1-like [Xenia sp. Carnegie-2017]|uniref:GATA-type zinc finger protein 1-like n=1 Tax=Xenia sp. Carnegie-2017 TaxID=2897299 RepID=UPI001F0406A7|nr:GATA-type zinc finger protein 1-like [Xenia sp. Carnegie-2017]
MSNTTEDISCNAEKENLQFFSHRNLHSQDSNGSSCSSCPSISDSPDLTSLKTSFEKIHPNYYPRTPKKSLIQKDKKRVTPRKPLKPSKSENKSDPSFRGVTLEMKTNIKRNNTDMETQLVIRSYFTAKRKDFLETRFKFNIYDGQMEDTKDKENFDELGCKRIGNVKARKQCRSCGVLKTPLWRDVEGRIPLCNACGIRYKKYRIHCERCWYIPRKYEKDVPGCVICGHSYQLAVPRICFS